MDPKDIVFAPNEIGTLGSTYIGKRRDQKDDGIPLYFDLIDKDLIPMLDGEIMTIIGRPGSGKTGWMMRWARARAHWLANNNITNRIVVFATWEQHVEDLHAFHVAAEKGISVTQMSRGELSDIEWKEVLRSSIERINLPLWFIGHSIERRKRYGRIGISDITEALHSIEDWGNEKNKIDIVFLDYLQRIPYNGKESKTIGISDNLDAIKNMALEVACPVVVGAQARREVEERRKPIPMLQDGQWSSEIEQTSDKVLSLVRPGKYRKDGEKFGSLKVEGHCQMLVNILKQKLGPDNESYWVYFDPTHNQLSLLESKKRNTDLSGIV